jgi:hypothetical protein
VYHPLQEKIAMRTILLPLLAVLALAQRAEFPPDIVHDRLRDVLEIDPVHYRKDLDNERVRVLHARLGVGEAVPMHDDRGHMIVAITEVHIRLAKPGAPPFDVHMQAGESRWGYADMHSIRNLHTRPVEYLIVELK